MTQSKAQRHGGSRAIAQTVLGAYSAEVDELLAAVGADGTWHWPNTAYRLDPVRYCRETLGLPVWCRMAELLEAVRDYLRVAVRAGRKVSKSLSDGVVSLWWYSSWHDGKTIMTSTTARQVDAVLWEELRKLHARSRKPMSTEGCWTSDQTILWPTSTRALDGEPLLLARSGLTSGFRSVVGFTAREGVAAAGVSGAHQLWIIDEASGVAQAIIDAIVGNMAGGGRLLLSGNPTRDEGELHNAFHGKRRSEENPRGYYTLQISSEESPNARAGRTVIPGMAEGYWIEERKREWGEDSAEYQIHVKGNEVSVETGKILSLQHIKEAQDRQDTADCEGVLHVGIDPAFAEDGDEASFVARRGLRALRVKAERGLDEKGHVRVLEELLDELLEPGEVAVVNLDALGNVGAKVLLELRVFENTNRHRVVVFAIRGSEPAQRAKAGFKTVRDELWGSVAEWIRSGGAIPEDAKLERDLHAPAWVLGDLRERKIATDKKAIRKTLGRSPDRGDALCLACWDNTNAALWARQTNEKVKPRAASQQQVEPAAMGIDPYAGADAWGRNQ